MALFHQTPASQNGTYTYSTTTNKLTATADVLVGGASVRIYDRSTLAHTVHALNDTTNYVWTRQILRSNLKDFGAVGDGVTDDSTAINAAIAAVTSNNGAVTLPQGTFLIGSATAVTFPPNVQLVFEQGAQIGTSVASQTINGPIAAHTTQQIFAIALNGAVTATGTSPPTVTVSGFANAAYSFKIVVTTGGALGTAVFEYSLDGGTSYVTGVTTPVSGIYVIAGTGVTVTFSSGTYHSSTADTYTWSSTASETLQLTSLASDSYPVMWWGAQGNAQQVTGAAISSSSATLTASSPTFAPTDVGKAIVVTGAGTNGGLLTTTILSYQSDTQVTLSTSASTSVGTNSSVVAAGSSPPTVTVSGNPLVTALMMIQISVGRALGTMKFQYSTDGGLSWSPRRTVGGPRTLPPDPAAMRANLVGGVLPAGTAVSRWTRCALQLRRNMPRDCSFTRADERDPRTPKHGPDLEVLPTESMTMHPSTYLRAACSSDGPCDPELDQIRQRLDAHESERKRLPRTRRRDELDRLIARDLADLCDWYRQRGTTPGGMRAA